MTSLHLSTFNSQLSSDTDDFDVLKNPPRKSAQSSLCHRHSHRHSLELRDVETSYYGVSVIVKSYSHSHCQKP